MQFSKHFEFDFDHSIEILWALVTDTPRWGEACVLPRYQVQEQLQQDGSVKITGNLDVAGFNLAWEEPPVNWIQPLWFEQQRLFTRGPLKSMISRAAALR